MSEIKLEELEDQIVEIICKITGMEKEEIKKAKDQAKEDIKESKRS